MMDARFGKLDVTPTHPVPLAGFGGRLKPFASVAEPIELNAALLQHDGGVLLIVSGDFLYFSATLRDRIVQRFGPSLGLRRSDVLLAASHTHFAPNLDPSKPLLGAVDSDYERWFEERLDILVEELSKAPAVGVTVHHARIESRHNVNRRVLGLDATGAPTVDIQFSDPGGACDPWLDVLRFDDAESRLRCAAVRYACHPTSSSRADAVSPNFPGVIRNALREFAGQPDLPVLFLQGFAGQLRPEADTTRAGGSPATFDTGLEPVPRSVFTEGRWMRWAKSLAKDACTTLEAAAVAPVHVPTLSSQERSIALRDLIDGLPAEHKEKCLGIQVITLTSSLILVALSAEPTSGWADIVSDLLPGKTALAVGYANQVFGYLPTAREASQGGYEVAGFMRSFSMDGAVFAPDFADRVWRDLEALLAPLADAADASAYAGRVAALRKTIDRLLNERDHMRALMLKDRAEGESAINLAEARLAGVQGRAEQLDRAAANLRELLRTALEDLARLRQETRPEASAKSRN